MNTFSGRTPRRAVHVAGGALFSLLALTACASGTHESDPGQTSPTAVSLGSLGELDGLKMINTSWESYRTAKVTEVTGSPDARTLDVTYEATDATCEALAGFALRRTEEQVFVTLVIGHEDGCEPGTTQQSVTTLPLNEPLGTATPVVSEYSEGSIEIG